MQILRGLYSQYNKTKNCEISAKASLAALSPFIIKSKQKALLKTIKSLIKLYQLSTFPEMFTILSRDVYTGWYLHVFR